MENRIYSNKKFQRSLLAAVICYIGFILGFEDGGLQSVLTDISDDFGFSGTQTGSLASVQFAGTIIGPMFAGVISDRIGKKKVIIASCIIFAAAAVMCFCAEHVGQLYAGLLFVGISFGSAETAAIAVLADTFEDKSAKYISLMQGILSLGAVFSPILMYAVISSGYADWRFMFTACSGMSAVAAAFFYFIKIRKKISLNTEQNEKKKPVRLRAVFSIVITGVAFSIGIYIFMENGVAFFIDSFYRQVYTDGEASASAALSLFWLAMALSRLMCSVIYKYRYKIIAVCFFCSAVLLVIIVFAENMYLSTVLFFFLGMFYGPIWSFLMSIASTRDPENSGLISGIMLLTGGIGGMSSPLAVGMISDLTGLRAAFILIAALAVAGGAIYMRCCYKYLKE